MKSRTLLFFVFLIATISTAHADLLGDTIKPFASLSEQYDSNIFRVKDQVQLQALIGDNKLGDFITIATVGTGIHYMLSNQTLDLSLKRDFITFRHYHDQSVDRDDIHGKLALSLYDQFKVNLTGAYLNAPEPRADYRSAAVNERRDISGGAAVLYEMHSGLGFEGGYRHSEVAYSLAQYSANDYNTDTYQLKLNYRVSPLNSLYVAVQREERSYQAELTPAQNINSTSNSFGLGVNHTVSPRTSLYGYLGYLQRNHKDAASLDFTGVVGRGKVVYGVTSKLGWILDAERQLNEENYLNSIYSVNNAISTGLVYALTEKIQVSGNGKWSWKSFRDIPGSGAPSRTDRSENLAASFQWVPLAKLTFNLAYQYETRSSDKSEYDFTDHTLTTSFEFLF